jgi:hypothetical protein
MDVPAPVPAPPPLRSANTKSSRPWILATALAIGSIFALRCHYAYTHPILWGDDWLLFARFTMNPGLAAVLDPHAGYVSLLPNLVVGMTSWLPLTWQPYLLAWIPGLIGIACLSWFASPRFAHILPEPPLRRLTCILLALIPASNAALLSVTMFSSWHLLFALCLAVIAKAPEGRRARCRELVLLGLCICSHPVSIIVCPFFAIRALTARAFPLRLHYIALVGISLTYFFALVGSSSASISDWRPPAQAAIETMSHWVVGDSLLPGDLRTQIPTRGLGPYLLLLPVLALCVFAWRSRKLTGSQSTVVTTLVLLSASVIAATIAGRHAEYGKLMFSPRYTYVPTLCWYLAALIVAFAALRGQSPRLRVVAILALVLHAVALNNGRGYRYRTSPADGDKVAAFVEELADWRKTASQGPPTKRLALPGRQLIIERQPPARPDRNR